MAVARKSRPAQLGAAKARPARVVTDHPCQCGCGVDARKATAVDPAIKERAHQRLRRIEGQVRGLQKMVEEERYCADVLTQLSSVQEALRAVGKEILRNHLKHCATSAIRTSDAEAEKMYDELVGLMYTHVR